MAIYSIDKILNEAKYNYSTARSLIINSSMILISHMMKCVADTRMSSGWIGTIFNQSKELNKVDSPSHWSSVLKEIKSDPSISEEIMNDACKLFIKDFKGKKNNQDAIQAFNTVTSEFPIIKIDLLKDGKLLWSFLYRYASIKNDYDTIELLDTKYSKFKN